MVTVVVILPDADVDEDCVELTLSVMDGVWVMVAVPDRVIDEEISATGKKIELYQTVFNQAFLCFSLIAMKFWYSIFSR